MNLYVGSCEYHGIDFGLGTWLVIAGVSDTASNLVSGYVLLVGDGASRSKRVLSFVNCFLIAWIITGGILVANVQDTCTIAYMYGYSVFKLVFYLVSFIINCCIVIYTVAFDDN